MIRVRKTEEPTELAKKGYKCDEVKSALLKDQDDKCYLCERHVITDYQVEHLESQHGAANKVNDWKNLFLACNYCNDRKKVGYDDIPHPDADNWEEIIDMRMDTSGKRIVFSTTSDDEHVKHLITLLDKLHNGKDKMRKLIEKRFWDFLFRSYSEFLRHVYNYLEDSSSKNRDLVCMDLRVTEEFLALKYSFIKANQKLYAEFGNEMKWNRK